MNNTGRINKIRARSNFTQIHNDVLQNVELSLAARGLLAFILSLPDDWILMKDSLHTRVGAKKGTVDAVFKELQVFGYIISTKCMDEKGRFQGWNHDVYEDPSSADKDVYRSRFFPKSATTEVGESKPIQRNNIIGLQSIESDNKYISIVDATASEIDVPVKTAKSSKPPLPAQPEYSSEFEKFWKAYDKPEAGGKKQSYEKWKKLTKETHDLILLYVNWYTKQQPDKQYRKNPITFFNQQPWIDFKPESEKQRTNATNFDTRTLFGELA